MLMGGCFCRFVRYRIDAQPAQETNCHCTVCRGTSGAPYLTWFTVPRRSLSLLSGVPTSFASSERGSRTFCPRCGTQLTFSSRDAPDEIDVTTGSLDAPESVPPKADIYVTTKLPWVALDPALPSHRADRKA
jgi:hypothetical protein